MVLWVWDSNLDSAVYQTLPSTNCFTIVKCLFSSAKWLRVMQSFKGCFRLDKNKFALVSAVPEQILRAGIEHK